ncbi:MAG: hypothetical protein JW839_00380 [Candidatus Lokiarchaeota archaeon]|nr:hypothetical protein [Candidatus Lokiarchaeota archaeon]
MRRHIAQLALAGAFVISFIAATVHGVSAVSEFVAPYEIHVTAGSRSTTSTSYLTGNDSQYMTFYPNKSGDKNFYEAYKIESDADITKYFNVTYPHYQMPVEYKEEKAASDYVSHKKVIRVQDRNTWSGDPFGYYYNQFLFQRYPVHNDSALNVTNGFFEFYFLSESTNGTFMVSFGDSKYARYYQASPLWKMVGYNHGISFGITPIGGPASQFFLQTSWDGPITKINSSVQYQANKWYHVKLAFHFNDSWSVWLDGVEAYNSSAWNINSTLELFNTVSMMTAIRTAASYHASHVYYIDAMGLSYNLTAHNAKVSAMPFNADYEAYVDIDSHNNLNDHVAEATFSAYFIFDLRDMLDRASSSKLYLKARFTPLAGGKGLLWFYNQTSKTYHKFANYTPYIEYPAWELAFENDTSGPTIINRPTYVSDAGIFCIKIEADSTSNFQYLVDYMVVEFVLGADMSQVLIIIFAVLGVVVVYVLYQVTRRGAPRARAGARKARRNLR